MVNRNTKLSFLVAFCLLTLQSLFATNFYCDPVNGKTTNDGSKEKPWKTLQSVFENGKKFIIGDNLYLLTGNHGHVQIVGENEKYINIIGVESHRAVVNSIVFGTEILGASRWTLKNITFDNALNNNTILINPNSSKIRLLENNFLSNKNTTTAIELKGSQCKIENNIISAYKKGINISGEKNQIRNNRIDFFSQYGVEISGSSNLLEYNIIKESIAINEETNIGIFCHSNEITGTIMRGNTILNFTKPNRKHIGLLHGIYGTDLKISSSIFENNLVISNGTKGIYLKGELNNLKIVNNTVVNPYFGLYFNKEEKINSSIAIQLIGENESSNLIIKNNLANNILFDNIKGIADHNLTLPVSVHAFDDCFKNWALFDFSLNNYSIALNTGTSDMAPKLDATLNKRTLGNFVNIGAFEFTKIDEGNEQLTIIAEQSDRQLHAKGKGDWDGQTQIRIGGVGEGIDGSGVFPFKLPNIPKGKKVISANFKVHLTQVDNQPQGGIDLYGLPPKTDFWVTEDMYYQGTFGQDISARPIQNNFIDSDSFTGEINTSPTAKNGLKDYLNTIITSKTDSQNFLFLRMNPNANNVTDFNRWNFASANSKENRPSLEITIGYPEFNQETAQKIEKIKNTIASAPNLLSNGDLNFYFLGFHPDDLIQLKLFNLSGQQVYEHRLKPSDLHKNTLRTKNLKLATGKYILESTTESETKKQILFVW
ncbi:right-handed parallel beta-helix repeat-containing protein [Flavicella sediminum]|uniref:right-handed parallel beta-helix repeat-containing protein n=1 Tax=Flavicella sediminum TaxID=2585141 RepID=UPI001120B801|nr:right-handed parallel beta-helix repeat-containing protein [Flavicella sediminum]